MRIAQLEDKYVELTQHIREVFGQFTTLHESHVNTFQQVQKSLDYLLQCQKEVVLTEFGVKPDAKAEVMPIPEVLKEGAVGRNDGSFLETVIWNPYPDTRPGNSGTYRFLCETNASIIVMKADYDRDRRHVSFPNGVEVLAWASVEPITQLFDHFNRFGTYERSKHLYR